MKFTFSGTGTSQGVPVIACPCEVCQSTDPHDKRLRTSGILQSDTTTLVFDTGPDFRQQMLRHQIGVLDAVVFTHQHKDHVAGMDDVRAYNFLLQRDMPVYATEAVLEHLKREYYYIFENAQYPGVPKLAMNLIQPDSPFEVGDMQLTPIPVMHGSMPVLGYRIGNFAYVTDVNAIPESSMARLQGLDTLVLGVLRHEVHYSHFSLSEGLEVIERLAPKQTYLTHISHLMGKHADIDPTLPEGVNLAYDGLVLEW
ncbi:MBL fold metallo-hydrolase [Pontibacter sp. G13]|uniref:MBL fold metallo-hydrolase n=1 Tax=Pontibacter sp. G13 TaxID=3074898 RepID=UPI00288B7E59|nr:MBL fold metallo-hydrolase [Pontibacter sp. G13]WNJ18898.1 MBL fold metallo-hydrolase [Pontibacter sp. G13]